MLLRIVAVLFGVLGLVLSVLAAFSFAMGGGTKETVVFFCLGGIMFTLTSIGELLEARLPRLTK